MSVDTEGLGPENKVKGSPPVLQLWKKGRRSGTAEREETYLNRRYALVAFLAVFSGCRHIPGGHRVEPGLVRPAVPTQEQVRVLRPIYPSGPLALETLDSASAWERNRFSFQVYCDLDGDYRVVRGEYYRTLRGEGEAGFPLIAIAPILGGEGEGYLASRFIARECCRSGFSAFFLYQERTILSGQRDALGLESRMRHEVRDNISALTAFSALDEVDAGRLGSFGVSLGAIRNVVLIAAEPRLKANVLCLGGLDLVAILRTSRETMVLRYLSSRMERESLSSREVELEFRKYFASNPANLAGGISPRKVLMFLSVYDEVVPYNEGLALRQMLGAPEAYLMPLGHYTALLGAPWITYRALGWVSGRFAGKQLSAPR